MKKLLLFFYLLTSIEIASGQDLVRSFADFEEFRQFGGGQSNELQVKFVLPDFSSASTESALFFSPTSYRFHDDWFLMQLFNGKKIANVDIPPYANLNVKSPRELQEKLKVMSKLPEGIIKINDRVVADVFYKMSLGVDRKFGLGSVIYSVNANRLMGEIVAFDMTFNDEPTVKDVEIMWNRVSKAIKRQDLRWLPRSAQQETLARALQGDSKWQARIALPSDFVVPGEIRIYSKSIVAGIPVYFPKGNYDPSRLTSQDIAILEELPDDLPPVRGIITSVPQTELAHVNLLARARGTLNVFVADPALFGLMKAMAEEKKPLAFSVLNGRLFVDPISLDDYRSYQNFFQKDQHSLPPFDTSTVQYLYDLSDLNSWPMEKVIRTVGGKSLGMNRIMQVAGIPRPAQVFALSVRAYKEHMNISLEPILIQALQDKRFVTDAKMRFLVLEGPKKFSELYPELSQKDPYVDLIAGLENSAIGTIVLKKGVKNWIENQPLNPLVEADIVSKLSAEFPNLPSGQAFRFRSSADVEDIPGFVGAGLYDSETGFLNPVAQALSEKDKKKTVARAIKKTWASYWNYRAFEERAFSNIDHLTGSMAVMIHPNFPESVEKANGVLTITWQKAMFGDTYQIRVNTNAGDKPVVRPDGSIVQPQTIDMSYTPFDQNVLIKKYDPDSNGIQVLTNNQAKTLAVHAVKILEHWLRTNNKDLKPEWQPTHFVLDMEFKLVPEGWLSNLSSSGPDTFVIKQARPLMKSQKTSVELEKLPIPRSLLGEATQIIRRTAKGSVFDFSTIEVYKATTAYDGAFNANAIIEWKQNVGGKTAGEIIELKHTDFKFSAHPFMHHGPWDFSFELKEDSALRTGIKSFNIYESGQATIDLTNGLTIHSESENGVETESLLENAESWLKGLVCRLRSPPAEDLSGETDDGVNLMKSCQFQ